MFTRCILCEQCLTLYIAVRVFTVLLVISDNHTHGILDCVTIVNEGIFSHKEVLKIQA